MKKLINERDQLFYSMSILLKQSRYNSSTDAQIITVSYKDVNNFRLRHEIQSILFDCNRKLACEIDFCNFKLLRLQMYRDIMDVIRRYIL